MALRITLYPSKSKTDYLTFTRNYSHKMYTCAVCLLVHGQCTRTRVAILKSNVYLGDLLTESLSYTAILVAHSLCTDETQIHFPERYIPIIIHPRFH